MGPGQRRSVGSAGGDHLGGSHWLRRFTFLTVVLGALALIGLPAAAQAEGDGAQTYQQMCASCHQADGAGIPGTFPPLAGNPNVSDPAYVAEVIRNGKQGPIEVLGQTYDGVMPPVAGLTDAQIESVAAYVASLAAQTEAPATTVPSGPVSGSSTAGEDLFVGTVQLVTGGPACSACHAAASFGGASLGPDLTDAFSRLGGDAGVTGWLSAPPSPTMQPIFADHPLDPTEITDLVAYLAAIDGTTPERGPDVMLIGGFGGLVLLFALMALVFKRPRARYVDRLRSKT